MCGETKGRQKIIESGRVKQIFGHIKVNLISLRELFSHIDFEIALIKVKYIFEIKNCSIHTHAAVDRE